MAKHSKKYREAAEKVDRNNLYTPDQAIALLKSMPTRNFDEAVEAVVRLNVDPRKADQLVRGTVSLPNGTGKTAKVLVFARGPKATEATEAGADIVGDDDLVQKVADGFLDFDSVVATPDMMGKVGRLGRVLGPRGLMPNPKTGTVTMDVTKAIKDIKGGKVDFRVDKNGNLCPDATHKVKFNVRGLGSYRAAANGDPSSLESFQAPQMSLFKGQLTAVVQTEETPGVIVFEASAPGVKSAKIELISE